MVISFLQWFIKNCFKWVWPHVVRSFQDMRISCHWDRCKECTESNVSHWGGGWRWLQPAWDERRPWGARRLQSWVRLSTSIWSDVVTNCNTLHGVLSSQELQTYLSDKIWNFYLDLCIAIIQICTSTSNAENPGIFLIWKEAVSVSHPQLYQT